MHRQGDVDVPFSDYFFNHTYEGYLEFNENQNYHCKKVYYLHGALFIFVSLYRTLKIKRGGSDVELINLISEKISQKKYPLFVSEGTSSMKQSKIFSNNYLSFCFRKLKDSGNAPIVIYGASFLDNDRHIWHAIDKKNRRVYVGIYTDAVEDQAELIRQKSIVKTELPKSDVIFFNSSTLF